MPNQKTTQPANDNVPFILAHKLASTCVLAFIVLVFSLTAWWTQVYQHPKRVFEGMIKSNLSLNSITRTINSSLYGSTTSKAEQLSYVNPMAVRSVSNVVQGEGQNKTVVLSETIGSQQADFNRYIRIQASQKGANGKTLDYSSVQGTWGKVGQAGDQPQYFTQANFGVLPFARLSAADQAYILPKLLDGKVYNVDYSKVTVKKVGDKSAIVVPVSVSIKNYLMVFKEIVKRAGYKGFETLDPNQYASSKPAEVKVTIDKASRHLLAIDYGNGQQEQYGAHGLSLPIAQPETSIPYDQLQQKIQGIQ